jgi:hypothetical protein
MLPHGGLAVMSCVFTLDFLKIADSIAEENGPSCGLKI